MNVASVAPLAPFGTALLALLLDRLLGEPARFHPLVGFGRYADALERLLRRPGAVRDAQHLPRRDSLRSQKAAGIVAWALAVLPLTALACWLRTQAGGWIAWGLDVVLLYFALGAQSLRAHVLPVAQALEAHELGAARSAVGRIVSRETAALDEAGVARAAVETTLENGSDAIFGALFWFAIAGGPGALAYRLANTLDAMWGYRNDRFLHFGWAAARLDDGLGYLPARLTALTYALLGRTRQALACWRSQAPAWDSPNAGPVMASGAGSLGRSLGGAAVYHGRSEPRPPLGCGPAPSAADIRRALALVERSIVLWLVAGLSLAALRSVVDA